MASAIRRPLENLIRGYDHEPVWSRRDARPPQTIVAHVRRRRSAIASGVVRRLSVATGAANFRALPILIHVVVLSMAVTRAAILGFARLGEEEAQQHAERDFGQGAGRAATD